MNKLLHQVRFSFKFIAALIKRKLPLLKRPKFLIVLPLLFLLGLGVYIIAQRSDVGKATLVEGFVGTYREEDLPEQVTNLMSASLINIDKSGLPQKNLVSSWDINQEGTIYTFKLKDNLFWWDRSKIKAGDIDVPIPDVEKKVLDDKTIQFKLADPFSPFPTLLSKPIFKRNTRMGTGPYKLVSMQKDQIFVKRVVLQPVGDRSLPLVVIKFYPNERSAKNALRLGEIQVLGGVVDLGDLSQQKNLKIFSKTNFNQLVTIFYNTKDPVLSDDNLRLALSFAAPSIKSETEAKTSIAFNNWAINDQVKDYLDNKEQAMASLKKVQNLGNIKKENPVVLTSTSSLKNVGERVVEAWSKLGIKSVLRVESGIPQNFQALLISQNIPSDPDQYSLWHSTQLQTNISHFANPRVDKDLEDGRKTIDLESRKAKYQDFQKVLMDHAPATFLYFPKYNLVLMKKAEISLNKITALQFPRLFNQ